MKHYYDNTFDYMFDLAVEQLEKENKEKESE